MVRAPFTQSILSLALVYVCLITPAVAQEQPPIEKSSWSSYFDSVQNQGTIVVADLRPGSTGVYAFNLPRAGKRYTPASTFKLPHALFALDAGVLKDDQQIIPWDGKKRFHPPWNQDQTLRSSVQHSAVWVYERFAQQLGVAQEKRYLEQIEYGNADPTGDDPFWIKGNLSISALEQIEFLKLLYHEQLPFSKEHQQMVKTAMALDSNLSGKTGWDRKIGWWIGWAETPQGPLFIALNLDTPNGKADLPLRESIARSVLSTLGAPEP